MISFLKGILVSKTATSAEIDCGGIGYSCLISLNTSQKLPPIGDVTQLMTILVPREDSITLFGFFDNSEREAFRLLITVNGIGPKIALAVLSSLNVQDFITHIKIGNIIGLQKLPGIGRKTAERMILELKDKISSIPSNTNILTDTVTNQMTIMIRESILALVSLGYNHQQAEKYINSAVLYYNEHPENKISTEALLKMALQNANK